MNLELLTIGTELLLGFTLDTNGAEIARALSAVGVRVVRRASVGDEPDAIRDAVADALRRTGAVLTTGGLGPTRDDISKRVVADLFGLPLEFDQEVWDNLVARFAALGRTPAPTNRVQAEVPHGATVLQQSLGHRAGPLDRGEAGAGDHAARRTRRDAQAGGARGRAAAGRPERGLGHPIARRAHDRHRRVVARRAAGGDRARRGAADARVSPRVRRGRPSAQCLEPAGRGGGRAPPSRGGAASGASRRTRLWGRG